MMKKVKVLHLASFAGNIGDIANHRSFYHQLNKLNDYCFDVEELEIRDFYKVNQIKKFDENFVDYVNHFDLFVIGGGNFFEFCWDYSRTGTTFDISLKLLREIKTPIFINAIGVDDNKGASKSNINKFRSFLETIFYYNKVYFTVRNDGSKKIIKKHFPEFSDRISTVPDWGFGIDEVKELNVPDSGVCREKSIGFNIAIDMIDIRYKRLKYKEFLEIISIQMNKILEETDYNLILFPHIQSDYIPVTDILKILNPNFLRKRISVAPLLQGKELETFKLYNDCDMIFGMRFHANVCAISLKKPTYGILSYIKHNELYEEICLPHRKVDINEVCFETKFANEVNHLIKDDSYLHSLSVEYKDVKDRLNREMHNNLLNIELFLKEVL